VWLEEVRNKDVPLVGGKGASLGEMINAGLPVPGGFAVTAQAFRRFLEETGIAEELFKSLEIDVNNSEELKEASKKAKKLIMDALIPEDIKKDIIDSYKELCKKEGEEVFVAVRSSATAEDLPDASFAGQQETFLNVKGAKNVVDAVKKCWASLYGERAIFYRVEKGFDHRKVDLSAIVQKMANAEKAGVMFSSHPSTGEPLVIIEGSWGLGETIVSGSVSPDTYIVDRVNKKIISKNIATKNIMAIRDPVTGNTKIVEVPEDKKNATVLRDEEILKLAEIGERVEKHYGIPQDSEWGIENGKIYMLQSRPITTIKKIKKEEDIEGDGELLLEGLNASPGIAYGIVKIIRGEDELDKVKDGDILVTTMTTPDMVKAMKKAVAIITDEGGTTCHAAIVSRELGCPAVVGTRNATKVLSDGMMVTVDGAKGQVYKGKLEKAIKAPEVEAKVISTYKPITVTEVKVNISMPEAAQRAADTGADGVGLLRIEHMILELKQHPNQYIKEGTEEEYINELVESIKVVADAFYPKSVWVRTMDAPTDEFREMKGGESEPLEANPMLGWRGIRRDLKDTDHFKLELRAFKKLYEKGYNNIGIMLPLVHHPREVRTAKKIMKEVGLDPEKIELGIMVEVPAAALIIEEFIKEGIDFASFGTNDLTQYTLAVDRNNENVAYIFNEMHPAVLKLMEYTIKECNQAGVKTSICGQAGSDPKMVEKLVEFGISSVSANIDAVQSIREVVARTEQKMILDSIRKK
ncbi:MAG: phosphoenolpyruvate synthase, partial [Methanosarcinales archaeon]